MRRMKHSLRAHLALGTLLACVMASADTGTRLVLFDDLASTPQALGIEEQRYLAFGGAILDYYSDRSFAALSRLRVNQAHGLFDDSTEYAELLQGELFLDYGLPEQAGVIFERLLRKDILARTRAEAWLHKADLHYRQGDYQTATDILTAAPIQALRPEQQPHRQLLLANALIHQGEFNRAADELATVPLDSVPGAYASYNMGVAMVRAGQPAHGLTRLEHVAALPSGDPEINALKDRAALAIGLTELRQGRADQARAALLRVRADGPYSSDALMALGLANYRRGAVRSALPLWLELIRRDPAHGAVQEAMLLAPRAYEELGALPQALAGYQVAAEQFRAVLHDLEATARRIRQPGWLHTLNDQTAALARQDPMAWLVRQGAAQGDDLVYLHQLFAERQFAEQYRQYQQLVRLSELLRQHQQSIPVLQATLAERQQRLARVAPRIHEQVAALRQHQQQLADATAALAQSIPQHLDINATHDLAELPHAIMWQRVTGWLDSAQPSAAQRQRLERLRGRLLWEIAHRGPANRERQQRDGAALIIDADIAGLRLAALEQLLNDAHVALQSDLGTRLTHLAEQIEAQRTQTEAIINELGERLQLAGLQLLARQRQTLGEHLAEAHLSIARLQDSAARAQQTRGRQ